MIALLVVANNLERNVHEQDKEIVVSLYDEILLKNKNGVGGTQIHTT